MKTYPSIPPCTGKSFRKFDAYVFDKLDGSNLRFQWSKKKGWFKFGTKSRLVDETDEKFGPAIPLFLNTIAEPLEKLAKGNKWRDLLVFAEYWGEHSFAGYHRQNDPKTLTVFDAAIDKKGIVGPKVFLKYFPDVVPTAEFLGRMKWNRELIKNVWEGTLEGVTFEGIIGKANGVHDCIRSKAKSKAWIDRVKGIFKEEEASKLINS